MGSPSRCSRILLLQSPSPPSCLLPFSLVRGHQRLRDTARCLYDIDAERLDEPRGGDGSCATAVSTRWMLRRIHDRSVAPPQQDGGTAGRRDGGTAGRERMAIPMPFVRATERCVGALAMYGKTLRSSWRPSLVLQSTLRTLIALRQAAPLRAGARKRED